jgi:hypothetical protein
MNQAITALLGAVTGFLLSSLKSYVQLRMKGNRFENAAKGEIEEAKDVLDGKMHWVSRDHRAYRTPENEGLLVEFDGKLLFLGEPETFCVSLPLWEQNLRDIIELSTTDAFNGMCRDVLLMRKFVSKFRELKLTFEVRGGDPKRMALACYQDLIAIHDKLIPEAPMWRSGGTA